MIPSFYPWQIYEYFLIVCKYQKKIFSLTYSSFEKMKPKTLGYQSVKFKLSNVNFMIRAFCSCVCKILDFKHKIVWVYKLLLPLIFNEKCFQRLAS